MSAEDFVRSTGNVFADMGLDDADELLIRAQLGQSVRKILKEKNLKQREIAELLGIDQAEVSKLMNGKYQLPNNGQASDRKLDLSCLEFLIKEVRCEYVYLDREGDVRKDFSSGDFERAYGSKRTIRVQRPGGIEPEEFVMLPVVLMQLQEQHPNCLIRLRSVVHEGNELAVTVAVDDTGGRSEEEFSTEFEEIKNRFNGALSVLRDERAEKATLTKAFQELKEKTFPLLLQSYIERSAESHEGEESLAVLFLDLKGFSRMLPDEQREAAHIVRDTASNLIKRFHARYPNTWGDAVVAGFEDVNAGLEFACKLIQRSKPAMPCRATACFKGV